MKRRTTLLHTVLITAILGCSAGTVKADFLFNLTYGLSLFDYSSAVQRNHLGDGWDFNTVAFYQGQTYRMGWGDLTLGSTSPSLVNVDAGYTLRGIPTARFNMTTAQPLSYTLRANQGFQEFVATGNVSVNIDTRINSLGFYSTTFLVSNRGDYSTDGFGPTDSGSVSFDAGPIVVTGNIYVDLLALVLQPFFDATATENPFLKFSQRATKVEGMAVADDLLGLLNAGDMLPPDDVARLINNSVLAAVLGTETRGDLFGELILPEGLLAQSAPTHSLLYTMAIPEPGTLALLLGPLMFLAGFWRTRRGA